MKRMIFTSIALLGTTFFTSGYAQTTETALIIPTVVPYLDETLIQEDVLKECINIGAIFSKELAEKLAEKGIKTEMAAKLDTSKGNVLDVKIITMTTGGNFFIGKQTGGSAKVSLYKDGIVVKSKAFNQTSGGGMMGAYRSACGILESVVSDLSEDTTDWIQE